VDFLQVPIKPSVSEDRIEGLIDNYLDETISKYTCDKCKSVKDRQRIQKIVFAPEVLMITLKRITMDRYGRLGKDEDEVDYRGTLDLTSHRADASRGDLKYHLMSVISHQGDTTSGHYRCASKAHGQWHVFDDLEVDESSEREARDPSYKQSRRERRDYPWTPYLLFYQRDAMSLP
jgi:ubiquitin C-terminal hydrolase